MVIDNIKKTVLLAFAALAAGAGADTPAWIDFGPETNRVPAVERLASIVGFDSVTRTSDGASAAIDARRFAVAWQDGVIDTRLSRGFLLIVR